MSSALPALRRARTGLVAGAVALAAPLVVLASGPAQATVTGDVESGTATWGMSTYLGSANMGRPNPYPDGYVAPATFDDETKLSTWGEAEGTVHPDGSAELAFAGTSVNFAKTSGAWLRFSDLEVDLDADGNGSVTAFVEYGMSVTGAYPPGMIYDPEQEPHRAGTVEVVQLADNTSDDVEITDTTAAWTDLDGAWSEDFTTFLAGDDEADPAIAEFVYVGQISEAADRTALPISFEVTTAIPTVEAEVTSVSEEGVSVAVSGDGFRRVTNPGDAGVYVGLAPSGGLPDVSSQDGMDNFAAVAYPQFGAIATGDFTATLDAPLEDFDPSLTYSVYTWQAHTHSNTTQDTETPVEIDFTPFLQASTTTPAGPAKRAFGVKNTVLAAAVPGPGTVTLTGVGKKQTATAVETGSGYAAAFVVPANLKAGKYTATYTYSGGGWYLGSQATKAFTVTKAKAKVAIAWPKKPTANKPGKVKIKVTAPGTIKPNGKVTVELKKGKQTKRVAGKLNKNGVVTLKVAKLAKGKWTVKATYPANANFTKAAKSAKVQVKKK